MTVLVQKASVDSVCAVLSDWDEGDAMGERTLSSMKLSASESEKTGDLLI